MTTELAKIAERIRARATLDAADRKRQRALIRERIAAGATWDDVQREARVSRPTIAAALQRQD